MSVIKVDRIHTMPLPELRSKIDRMIDKIQQDLDVNAEWISESELIFSRRGAKGSINIDESNFHLQLQLGIMFRMLQGTISQQINTAVDGQLA